ncbi:PIN domain-containing protein [Neorhizobium tomejilense]|uniref:PIN domain-containing protein n=1 Tax=Neorhizobium tomejilense TaxID=2093828 RepID=UPI000CFA4733|nr:PIN domain-containing protein [Neorhizobium tomejilense]
MPITEEAELSKLLANGQINAISVDTNIFDEKSLQLNGAVLLAVSRLAALHFDFLLSGTVAREIKRHLERSAADAIRSAKKAVGLALGAFEIENPTRDDIIDQICGGQTVSAAAEKRFNDYLAATHCQVLADTERVDTVEIFDAYFAGDPPFGTGAKKNEFPDALALYALEHVAAERAKGIIIVSKDGDWRSYCEKSERLHLVPDIERALSLINDPPVVLRAALRAWFNDGDGEADIGGYLSRAVEGLEFSVNGNASSGEMEAHAWAGELRETQWPEPDEIDIIDMEDLADGTMEVTLSIPLLLTVRVPIELEFSIWDSVDRESVGMGGRTIEPDEELDMRATVNIKVQDLGGEDEQFDVLSCELDASYLEIELGDIDIFEPEDYDQG